MDVTLKKAGNFQPFSDRSHLAIMIGFAYVINYVGTSRNLSCGIKGVTKMDYVIEMLNIRKEFPGVVANDNITLQLKHGEIHALLGENGAGKTTLMNVLFGLYQPEKGKIRVKGKKIKITDPKIANSLGIGMVQQHFILIDTFTVTQNIILRHEPTSIWDINLKKVVHEDGELTGRYGLHADPNAQERTVSVEIKQGTNIL